MDQIISETYAMVICVNCHQYMQPPVKQCGWCAINLCSNCSTQDIPCPSCNRQNQFKSVYLMNQILDILQLPCRHEWCRFSSNHRKIKQHEISCHFRKKLCPLKDFLDCQWSGKSKNQLIRHCKILHSEKVFVTDQHVFKISVRNNFHSRVKKHCFAFFDVFNEFFQFYQCYDFNEGVILWKMCYNSGAYDKVRFIYEISFEERDGGDMVVLMGQCELLRSQDFSYSNFLKINFNQVSNFCVDDDLCYRVRIIDLS